MFDIFCPICGKRMKPCIDHFECETCGVFYNIAAKMFYITNNAPKYVVDSYNVLKIIHENKWMFVFGKSPLFTEGFSIDDCVGYQSSAEITAMTPKHLLGYSGTSSIHLHTLVYGISDDRRASSFVQDIKNPMTIFSMWASSKMFEKKSLDYNKVKTLTAVMSPTWYDCVEVLRDTMRRDITTWSDSELLSSYVLCNKLPIVQDCSLTECEDALKKFIVNQCKFIHKDNSKLSAIDVEKKKEAYEILMNSKIELGLINDWHMDPKTNVQWLFATNNAAIPPNIYSQGDVDYYAARAEGLWRLWETYVKDTSLAHYYIIKYEVTTPDDKYDARATYINYWSKVREQFE